MRGLSTWQFVVRSFLFHKRINFAVTLGVAAATAVLVGALLVGDSMRGSLRSLTLNRLGKIDNILVTDRFFRSQLADDLIAQQEFTDRFTSATPAIFLPQCTLKTQPQDQQLDADQSKAKASEIAASEDVQPLWASGVFLIGIEDSFWQLDSTGLPAPGGLAEDEIILNAPLAEKLEVHEGDLLSLYMPKSGQVPADSPLGRRDDSTEFTRDLKVNKIIPAEGLGRFSLSPNQMAPLNAFVASSLIQHTLDQVDRINAILVAGKSATSPPSEDDELKLNELLNPKLEDYGLTIHEVQQTYQPDGEDTVKTSFRYYQLTSERLIINPTIEVAAEHAFASNHGQPALTYMAITIRREGDPEKSGIPYSTISAIDSTPQLGPVEDSQASPISWQWKSDDEIILNSWAAKDLNVAVDDRVVVTFFAPETTHGEPQEESATFTVVKILPLTEPKLAYNRRRRAVYAQRPARINDPDLTPTVKGITDQDSLRNWDPPFPFEPDRNRGEDDNYWEQYRTTPKAFIPLETGQKLWGSSRFGRVTSYRIPIAEGIDDSKLANKLLEQLNRDKSKLGFDFLPVKREGLKASAGTTPFDGLFLGLSFFIIAAALLLVALLFRLGVEQRFKEIGLLCAVGVPRKYTTRLFVYEGVLVSGLGATIGTAVGIGYAWLMLAGLKHLWVAAIVTPFLTLFITPKSLIIGYCSGLIVSVLTIAFTIRYTRRISERQLLAGQIGDSAITPGRTWWFTTYLIPFLLAIAVVLSIVGTGLRGEAQAGAFVGGGALVLTALLLYVRNQLRRRSRLSSLTGRRTLLRLASRNASRNPTRSTMTLGLMATATFLIVAMSAFRVSPSASGTGGFDLISETDAPVYEDLNDATVRRKLLGDDADVLVGGEVLAFRLKPGDDASCLNLYKSTRPRVLGMASSGIESFSQPDSGNFAWTATAANNPEEKANPWLLLNKPLEDSAAIPVILDNNTAMYALQMYGGVGQEIEVEYSEGVKTRFKVVGLLAGSVLQGNLIIGEDAFENEFSDVNGYRFFLIRSPQGKTEEVRKGLRKWLGELGFSPQLSADVLANLLAVQNTYLSAFQSLGVLGLLLGVFGLATVQLRSVLERRSEMALMRATGFRRRRLARMVLLENVWLLIVGLATGVIAALLSVLPHILMGGANVPVTSLLWMLATVLFVGTLAAMVGVRATLKAPLVSALRGE